MRYGSVVPLVTARALSSREFTYELPDGAGKGAIVSVPFGRSRARGVVVDEVTAPPVGIKALPLYVDPSAKAAFVLDAAGLPASLLVDRAGREVGRHLGAVQWDSADVVEQLRRAIAAE